MSDLKFLIIDGNKADAQLCSLHLSKEKFDSVICSDCESAVKLFNKDNFDFIIMEKTFSENDGSYTLSNFRRYTDVPIIVLSSMADTIDKIESLNDGADDYIVKPYEREELIARINAVLRRTHVLKNFEKFADVNFDGLFISIKECRISIDGKALCLTPKELDLAYFLAFRENEVFSRETLYGRIWGETGKNNLRTVDVHITSIRKKLGAKAGKRFKTIHGKGYKFDTGNILF